MTAADLVGAMRAELDRLEADACDAQREARGPWFAWDDAVWHYPKVAVGGQPFPVRVAEAPPACRRLIAAVASPDVVLRRIERDRRVIERHGEDDVVPACQCCALPWPCEDLLDTARSLGIDPEVVGS